MKEHRTFRTTGHAEYNGLQVSVWHGSKVVTLSIYPAIITEGNQFPQIVLIGENLKLDVMTRLNRPKLEAMREAAFKQIEAKEGVAYDFFCKSLTKYGMSLPNCEQCGKPNVLHKVPYADDSGVESMMVCIPCDEKSQGLIE